MDIAIIGAGFTGLAAGYKLTKSGKKVTIFETDSAAGGLAAGFKKSNWKWSLDCYYHHFFTSDRHIINLAKEVGVGVKFYNPKTSTYINGEVFQLDSAQSLIKFPHLSFPERLRTGLTVFFLKVNPFWKILETQTSEEFIRKTMGEKPWRILWQPLFQGKFGDLAGEIPAYWFWTRIHKRSKKLGYPDGGYLSLAEKLSDKIIKNKGEILYNTKVLEIQKKKGKFIIKYKKRGQKETYAKEYKYVISTVPFKFLGEIFSGLPANYRKKFLMVRGLGAINMVIRLKKPFLKDKTYWLNINDASFPFVAVVEHTNLINKSLYGGEHLVYIGKYLSIDNEQFLMDDKKLISLYKKHLKKINSDFDKNIIGIDIFKTPYAQPIFPKGYSKFLPDVKSPIPRLFVATMQQVYPWDRGTNYAVEMGEKVADLILNQ